MYTYSLKLNQYQKFLAQIVIFGISVLVLFIPEFILAQGIVPTCAGNECGTCDLIELANNIIDFVIMIMLVLASILFVYAGFLILSSGGDQAKFQKGKGVFVNVVIGLIIILASWLVVDIMLRSLLPGGQVGINGGLPWNEIGCSEQVDLNDGAQTQFADTWDDVADDTQSVAPTNPGTVNSGLSSTCNPQTLNFPACSAAIVVNDNMNPLLDCSSGGCSSMVRQGAEARLQEILNGPFAQLQQNFGSELIINDAIAKAGTSREENRKGSRHFFGDAIDVSLAGMSNEDRIRLVNEAKNAGFTGFGLGNNILHIDYRPGPVAVWDYENSTYGGVSTSDLKAQLREN